MLGSDGLWKLCDFGSASTNHKRFEKPEEMGIEEDNIRKHTTPAYRAPEVGQTAHAFSKDNDLCSEDVLNLFSPLGFFSQMWDLYRRELINEKVDIWVSQVCLLCKSIGV